MSGEIKKFILTIGFGIVVLCSIYMLIIGVLCYQVRSIPISIPANKSILIIGDSHTECAINDSIWSESINLSKSADPFMYSYLKLKYILPQNTQIKTVVLSVNSVNISTTNGDRFLSKESLLTSNFKNYIHLFSINEWVVNISNLKSTDLFQIMNLKSILSERATYISKLGGYLCLKRDWLQASIGKKLNEKETVEYGNDNQYYYLLKIVDLCESIDVELVFVGTPLYNGADFFDIDNYKAKIERIKSNCNRVRVLDYSLLQLPDSCYADINHLNYRGASIFTPILKQEFNVNEY